ncbi:zinc finger protein 276 [Antechinus flavipes]|uniref:zinc finger protein 276 n=1 Tax=Antechinus flavipes TaxID=38775 RepID=UPI002236741F|nr:zinc finger protein 276 [Antechinus flavipes]
MKRDRLGRFLSPGAVGKRGLAAAVTSGPGSRARAPRAGGGDSGPEEDGEGAAEAPPRPRGSWGTGPPRACGDDEDDDETVTVTVTEDGPEEAGTGRPLSMGYCRLCHGKFSSRSLRHIFGQVPGESCEKPRRMEQVFFMDFKRLLGVPIHQDPTLPQFVCKNCHSQFYKCHSILKSFLQRVNTSPTGHRKPRGKGSPDDGSQAETEEGTCLVDLITSSPQCLHRLVGWAHGHAVSCGAVPSLQNMLSSEYCGIIQAVWGCDQGHDYIMDTDSNCSALLLDSTLAVKWEWDREAAPRLSIPSGTNPPAAVLQSPRSKGTMVPAGTESQSLPSTNEVQPPSDDNPVGPEPNSPPEPSEPPSGVQGQLSVKQVSSSALDDRVKDEFSDLSEGDFLSDDENDKRRNTQSSDESFEPYPEKKISGKMSDSKAKKSDEPKIRKKPGPKPGWKKKIKCEREELPTIYKCPYQGCTAVYRGADGMKKHIKEHHEEVRERPCPHPGCNKVFMIDRYLQRHVKLIHTEVRNYICDECGQTFKQRKHLSVHQMRHSGAKPLQCEICGFQCRQRASLKYHMTKHKAETELEFACDQCGRRFEKAHNLNVHMSMVHPLTQNQDKAKPLQSEQPTELMNPSGTMESQAVKPELVAQQEPT